jgi:hypothetical protein
MKEMKVYEKRSKIGGKQQILGKNEKKGRETIEETNQVWKTEKLKHQRQLDKRKA